MSTIRTLLLLSIVIIVVILLLFRESILLGIGSYLVIKETDLQPADLIHVLGGSDDRVPYGVQLHNQGYGGQILFTGRGPVETSSAVYESNIQYAEEFAQGRGLQLEGVIQTESLADTTYDEALELAQILERHDDIHSVIVVSAPYHMRRVRWTFDRVVGHRASLQFSPVPFETAQNQLRWWNDPLSREFVREEFAKMLFYRVRYHFAAGVPMNSTLIVEE